MIRSSRKRSVSTHTHTRGLGRSRLERRRRFNESNEGTVVYTAQFAYFFSEEDSYEKGIIGKGSSWKDDFALEEEDSLDELLEIVKQSLDMDGEGYTWAVETSGMNGTAGFVVEYEGDKYGVLASDNQIKAWKQGKERLWLFQVRIPVKKTRKPVYVSDDELKAFAHKHNLEVL